MVIHRRGVGAMCGLAIGWAVALIGVASPAAAGTVSLCGDETVTAANVSGAPGSTVTISATLTFHADDPIPLSGVTWGPVAMLLRVPVPLTMVAGSGSTTFVPGVANPAVYESPPFVGFSSVGTFAQGTGVHLLTGTFDVLIPPTATPGSTLFVTLPSNGVAFNVTLSDGSIWGLVCVIDGSNVVASVQVTAPTTTTTTTTTIPGATTTTTTSTSSVGSTSTSLPATSAATTSVATTAATTTTTSAAEPMARDFFNAVLAGPPAPSRTTSLLAIASGSAATSARAVEPTPPVARPIPTTPAFTG